MAKPRILQDIDHLYNKTDEVTDAVNQASTKILEINRNDVDRVTTFNDDGSITETYADGFKVITTFDSSTQITERRYKDDVLYLTKVTTFNIDGSISETLS